MDWTYLPQQIKKWTLVATVMSIVQWLNVTTLHDADNNLISLRVP
jgi:hypothetical protein